MNRADAEALIETGRALGHFERLSSVLGYLDQQRNMLRAEGGEPRVIEAIDNWRSWLARELLDLRFTAGKHRESADRLIADLEHPGARLARRVVHAARAAREAWRTAR